MRLYIFIFTFVIILPSTITVVAQENDYYEIDLSEELQDELYILCDEYEVDIKLIIAIIEVESTYQIDVISNGNYGLMQINKINHAWLGELLGIDDFLDPVQNMEAGIYLISQYMYATDDDIHKSLMMYKYGEYGAKRKFAQGITQCNYSLKVASIMDNLILIAN